LRLRENVSPYTQYVHAEQLRLTANETSLNIMGAKIQELKQEVPEVL